VQERRGRRRPRTTGRAQAGRRLLPVLHAGSPVRCIGRARTLETPFAEEFRKVSDWSETPAPTHTLSGDGRWYWSTSTFGTFAWYYGTYNPFEDWATTWEAVYARDRGWTGFYTIDPVKTAIVDRFFASLA
jgi:hypothetical protein